MAVVPWSCGGRARAQGSSARSGLTVTEVPLDASRALAQLAGRSMRLQVTIQEGHVLVVDGASSISTDLRQLKAAPIPH